MFSVATEELVRTHPRQEDLDPCGPSRLRHEQRVDGGRITDWLVQDAHHLGQQLVHVRLELDLVELDPVALCDLPGVDRIIRHGLKSLVLGPEGDGVGVDLRIGLLCQHGDDARVETHPRESSRRGRRRRGVRSPNLL